MTHPSRDEHEERQKALTETCWNAMHFRGTLEAPHPGFDKIKEETALLRNCVAISKDEYDMLQRALWLAMKDIGEYGTLYPHPRRVFAMFVAAGFQTAGAREWTPKAHEFAARMKEGKL